jgi:iron complex transport system substrate-binding protein
LRSTGIGVFRLSNFDQIKGILNNIRAVGYAVGEDRCADALVRRIKQRISQIVHFDAVHTVRPRALLYDPSGYTAGTGTLVDEMLHVVGARNVAAEHGIRGNTRISAEAVALWQPDFLITGASRDEFKQARRALMSEPAIANSPAGRTNRIIVIDDRFLLCVSQYFVSAVQALSDGLYGDTRTDRKP